MNKSFYSAIVLIITLTIGSCSSTQNDVIVSPKLSISKYSKIALVAEKENDAVKKTPYGYNVNTLNTSDAADTATFFSSIEGGFIRMGFDVLDRENINKILSEQELSQSGLVSISNAPEIGKLLGVNALVFIKYYGTGGYVKSVQFRMIDVETSSTLITANFSSSSSKARPSGVQMVDAIDATSHVISRKTPADVAKLLCEQIKEQIK